MGFLNVYYFTQGVLLMGADIWSQYAGAWRNMFTCVRSLWAVLSATRGLIGFQILGELGLVSRTRMVRFVAAVDVPHPGAKAGKLCAILRLLFSVNFMRAMLTSVHVSVYL